MGLTRKGRAGPTVKRMGQEEEMRNEEEARWLGKGEARDEYKGGLIVGAGRGRVKDREVGRKGHKEEDRLQGAHRWEQGAAGCYSLYRFIFSTLFFSHREDTRSVLGRFVLIVWLFVILIINSSYTANLTSILTVEQLAPTIQGLESLIQTNLPIGYQTGSFVRNYLINLQVNPARLKELNSREMYQKALEAGPHKGGVAAIVDELPYVQLFQESDCKRYIIAGQEFTKSGWGFVFPRDSDITADFSQAILHMSQIGELQHIRDYWFRDVACEEVARSAAAGSGELDLGSFWGLFLISGVASMVCVCIHLLILVRKYMEYTRLQQEESLRIRNAGSWEHVRQFILFADKSSPGSKPFQNLFAASSATTSISSSSTGRTISGS